MTSFLGNELNTPSENARIIIQSVPFDLTASYQKGTRFGPRALIEASHNVETYDIDTDSEVFRQGIYTAPELLAGNSLEMIAKTHAETQKWLKQGKFVATLGGEHSISYPLVLAHAEAYGPLSVLHLDAHADMHPALEGNEHSHGSVIYKIKRIEKVHNVVSVGIRSMSVIEKYLIDPSSIFFAHNLFPHDDSWMDLVCQKLSPAVYLTFDIDVLENFSATGTPEPGGLCWDQTIRLIKKVTQQKKIVGLDLVELMPIPGIKAPDFIAAKTLHKMLSLVFK